MRHAPLFLIALFTLLLAAQDVQAQSRSNRHKDKDEDRSERRDDRARRDRDNDRGDRADRDRDRTNRDRDRNRRGDDWYDDDRYDDQRDDEWVDEDEWDDDDYEGRRRGDRRRRRGNGPKFCRTGEGHPVHGRAWCIEKGYGLGNARYDDGRYDDRYDRDRYGNRRSGAYYRYDERRWRRVRAGGLRLDVNLLDRFRGRLDERALRRTLGRDAFYRLREHQRRLRLRGRLSGRLDRRGGVLDARRERELRVASGRRVLARFIDLDGDARVDVTLLRRRR